MDSLALILIVAALLLGLGIGWFLGGRPAAQFRRERDQREAEFKAAIADLGRAQIELATLKAATSYIVTLHDVFRSNFIISKILQEHLDIGMLEQKDENFKSRLLEWCQKHDKSLEYELLRKFRSNKRDRFEVCVLVDGIRISEASEYNKKGAEQIASQKAMVSLGLLPKNKP